MDSIIKIKRFIFSTLGIALFLVLQVSAQSADIISNTKLALKTGSSRELSRNFNDIIELSIDGEKSSYSKQHAEILLKNFFKKHPPADFQYVHQGSSKEGLKYAIGNYSFNGGEYRVYLLIKRFNGNYLINTLEFSQD